MPLRPIDLRALWNLTPAPTTSKFNSYPLSAPFTGVRLAIDSDGRRHLLVERDSDEHFAPSRGVVAESTSALAFENEVSHFLDIALEEESLTEEFDALICDVLGEGNIEPGSSRAGSVHSAIARWRSLLRLAAARSMSAERRLGLYGELVVLERLAAGLSDPWRWWAGPHRRPHDFELDRVCLEVKTMGVGSQGIRVHGLEQLLPDTSPLFLVVAIVGEDAGGRTLAELATDLKRRFADAEFDALLAHSGWSDRLDPGPPLVIEEFVTIPVKEGVPRLTPSDVPAGIFAVDYDLELETLRAHAVHVDFIAIASGLGGTA